MIDDKIYFFTTHITSSRAEGWDEEGALLISEHFIQHNLYQLFNTTVHDMKGSRCHLDTNQSNTRIKINVQLKVEGEEPYF